MSSLPYFLFRKADKPRVLNVETRLRIYIAIDNQLRAKKSLADAFHSMYNVITRGTRDGSAATPHRQPNFYTRLLARFSFEPRLARALRFWAVRLRAGSPLGDAMLGWLPSSEANLIVAGEKSKDLASTFTDLIAAVEQKQKVQDAVREATVYPLLLLSATFGISYFLAVEVVPVMASNANPALMSWIGKATVVFSNVLTKFWPVILATIIGLVIAFFLSLSRWAGRWRATFDAYLPYSLYRLTEGLSVMRAYQVLTTSGTKALVALNLLQENASPYIQSRLKSIALQIEMGLSLGHALDATRLHFPDDGLIENILLLPEDEQYSRNLRRLIDRWSERSLVAIQKRAVTLKIIGVITVSLIILFLYAGVNEMTSGLDGVSGTDVVSPSVR